MPRVVLLALCLAGVLLVGAQRPVNDEALRGSDYGDLIDTLRRQLDADSYSFGGDVSSPSTINRIRLQLRDIRDRLVTEATSARAVFDNQERYFVKRITKVNTTLNETKEWLDDVRNQTKVNSDRIVDRQIYLKGAPHLQNRARAKIEKQNATINVHIERRARTNIRFNHRLQHAKATLAGVTHVLGFLDVSTFQSRLTNLRDTLNVHHDPSMNALIASLGPTVMQEREADLGDVRALLISLRRQLHKFIVEVTNTEILSANVSNAKLETLQNVQRMNEATLEDLLAEERAARAEIADLMEKNIRMHKQYPAKVAKFQRLRKLQRKLIAGHLPLIRVYAAHKTQRDAQLKQVDSLLDIIRVHYDHPEVSASLARAD